MFVSSTTITSKFGRRDASILTDRRTEWIGVALAVTASVWLLLAVRAGREEGFADIDSRLAAGEAINLNATTSRLQIESVLAPHLPAAELQRAIELVEKGKGQFPRVGALHDLPGGDRLFPPHRISVLKRDLVVRTPAEWRAAFSRAVLWYLLSFLGYMVLALLVRSRASQTVVPLAAVLSAIGIAVQATCLDPLRDTLSFAVQADKLPWLVCLLLLGSLSNVERWTGHRTLLSGTAALGLLVLVLAFGTSSVPGVRINLWFGQPGELIRLLAVMATASGLARSWLALRYASVRLPLGVELPSLRDGIAYFGVLISLLFLLCRDQGPAAIMGIVTLAMYSVAAGNGRAALASLAAVIALAFTGPLVFPGFFATATTRFEMVRSPWDNMVRGGGHLAEMLYAFASGGWTGQGAGRGFLVLPEAHTDGVLPSWAEQTGWLGLMVWLAAMTLLVHQAYSIGRRARTEYGYFLCFGLATLMAVQCLLILAGTLGLLPLTGVTTPFLSFGNSSQISSFLLLACLLSVSARRDASQPNPQFAKPERVLAAVLVATAAVCALKSGFVAFNADEISGREGWTRAWNSRERAKITNPRLAAMKALIPRGALTGADGLIFATSQRADLVPLEARYRRLGIDIGKLRASGGRFYPAGPYAFHLIGDAGPAFAKLRSGQQAEWMLEEQLAGYTRADLVYLLRHRQNHNDLRVRMLRNGDRSVGLTVAFESQYRGARELEAFMVRNHPGKRAAAIVMDPASGALRFVASYPSPDAAVTDPRAVQDLARAGTYAPGSSWKVLTVLAAMRHSPHVLSRGFACRRISSTRVGNHLAGGRFLVRDDSGHTVPHGEHTDWPTALCVSCNATFGALGEELDPEYVRETAMLFGVKVPQGLNVADRIMTGYGQGPLAVVPEQMMRIAAVAANGGLAVRPYLTDSTRSAAVVVVTPEQARDLAAAERSVVTNGTAKVLKAHPAGLFGKTGTAQWRRQSGDEHAWFIGSTGHGKSSARLSFAFLVARGGHGGTVAAPLAGRVISQLAR